jgi:predicted MPP superfamily phosphohydrolase
VQISDLHLGSFNQNFEPLIEAVEMVNGLNPDYIFFTGDLVNESPEEAEPWIEIFSKLKAVRGKYAILGNHDYGEYYNWPSEEARQENMNDLLAAHKDSGFTVLLNQSARISLNGQNEVTKDGQNKATVNGIIAGNSQKIPSQAQDITTGDPQTSGQKADDTAYDQQNSNQEIYVAGVENWGLPPFEQYGDLEKALVDIPEKAYTILLSHDPSHWDAEVLNKSTVNLTLSGHTHGMQFGIRTKKFKWSPVQMKYPRWIGLYQQGYRYLHVNPGLGYIGYAGRIWIAPEISVITLKKTT